LIEIFAIKQDKLKLSWHVGETYCLLPKELSCYPVRIFLHEDNPSAYLKIRQVMLKNRGCPSGDSPLERFEKLYSLSPQGELFSITGIK